MDRHRIESRRSRGRSTGRVSLIILFLIILFGARSIASYAIEYAWWKEMGQASTWFAMLSYQFMPLAAGTLIAFAALWLAHARALKFAGTRMAEHRMYARLSTLALLIAGFLIASASIDTWTVVRYLGSTAPDGNAWRDPLFGLPLRLPG